MHCTEQNNLFGDADRRVDRLLRNTGNEEAFSKNQVMQQGPLVL